MSENDLKGRLSQKAKYLRKESGIKHTEALRIVTKLETDHPEIMSKTIAEIRTDAHILALELSK